MGRLAGLPRFSSYMALYHKWGVKTGFTFPLQFFMLISDSLGGVRCLLHSANFLSIFNYSFTNSNKKVSTYRMRNCLDKIKIIPGEKITTLCSRK